MASIGLLVSVRENGGEPSDPNDLQAWCYLCEEKFQQEGDMTDVFREFNGMTIVCVVCNNEAKARHAVSES